MSLFDGHAGCMAIPNNSHLISRQKVKEKKDIGKKLYQSKSLNLIQNVGSVCLYGSQDSKSILSGSMSSNDHDPWVWN